MQRLEEETGVAEAKKPIPPLHRLPIYGKALLAADEGGDEHDEGAFGEVEVGDEGVDALETIRGIDEDGSIAAAGTQEAVLVGDRL